MLPPWQTRASEFHPYRADDLSALPESLRGAAKAALPVGTKSVSALVMPTDYRSSEESEDAHPVPEQALVFTDSGVLHVQASLTGEAAPSTVYIQPENLLYLKSSHILLYGRLELFGSVQSEPVKLVMEFNSVAWPLMETEWRGLVCKAIGLAPPAPDEDRVESQREKALLESVPAKFAEGLRKYGLYTGEQLVGVIFQPAVWTQTLAVLDHQVAPNTLLALTDASMLVLEEERALVRKTEQYGLVVMRIPWGAIVDVQSVVQDSLEELRISIAREGVSTERRVLLEPGKAQFWRGLWEGRTAKALPIVQGAVV